MMHGMRKDGHLVCYRVQRLCDDGWKFDGYTEIMAKESQEIDAVDNYLASGICWQQTGVRGIYDFGIAARLLERLNELPRFEDEDFRLVRYELTQSTTPVAYPKGGFYDG